MLRNDLQREVTKNATQQVIAIDVFNTNEG